MNNLLVNSILSLSTIGIFAAAILFVVAKKFKVVEDPKIDEVEEALPGANCGGCGLAGCRNFAEEVVKTCDLEKYVCPVCSPEENNKIASLLGLDPIEREPQIAVLKCNGSLQNAPKKVNYEGAESCTLAHNSYAGESGCPHGCLGLGDCVDVCHFDALYIDKETALPVVHETNCTACGACVDSCPRDLFEIRPKGQKGRVYVACMNKEKGAIAKKNCSVACIGCNKCVKVSDPNEVSVKDFLSNITPNIDIEKYGQALVDCCPTKAILGVNFPKDSEKVEEQKEQVFEV